MSTFKQVASLLRAYSPDRALQLAKRFGDYCGRGVSSPALSWPSIDASLATLKSLGFAPAFCVDVGAYVGDWTQMFRRQWPDARVLMIEAQEDKRPELEGVVASAGGQVSAACALLGADDGTEVRFCQMETGSSIFEEKSSSPKTIVTKSLVRLDTLLQQQGHPRVDVIKIDVQGAELEVLKGAPVAMSQAQVILLEASLIARNEGCPLIREVIDYLDDREFRLFDFCSQIRMKNKVLWQTDLLFVKKTAPWMAAKTS